MKTNAFRIHVTKDDIIDTLIFLLIVVVISFSHKIESTSAGLAKSDSAKLVVYNR